MITLPIIAGQLVDRWMNLDYFKWIHTEEHPPKVTPKDLIDIT